MTRGWGPGAGPGVVYTRYCDDLAFSGTALDGVEERAEEGLRALGFRLNRAKRALCRDGQQKRVTGLVVNERVAVPACRRRRLRQELYFCRSRGVEEHLRGCRPGGGAGAVPAAPAGAGGLLAPGPAGQPGGGGVSPLAAGRDAG